MAYRRKKTATLAARTPHRKMSMAIIGECDACAVMMMIYMGIAPLDGPSWVKFGIEN
jgi:hypothetical protein